MTTLERQALNFAAASPSLDVRSEPAAEPAVPSRPEAVPQVHDHVAIGRLRAFVTLMVLVHHAVLSYNPAAPPPPTSLFAQPRWWLAFPVTDTARSALYGLVNGFNDTFFMSLMFFLSGLFVWSGVRRYGSGGFLRRRALRLGVPFVVAAALVAPLAYYPAYLQTPGAHSLLGFAKQWLGLGYWPAGPAWFLWVLLAFDALAALLFALRPAAFERLSRLASGARQRPAAFFALLLLASAAAYLPLALTVGPFDWASFGPFFVQTGRIAHYLVYFLAGIAVGAYGIERGLTAQGGNLARRWPLWLSGSLAAFVVAMIVFLIAISPEVAAKAPHLWGTLGALTFVLSCGFSSFAFLALFARFANRPGPVTDSLRRNAFGMYVIHYAFASWLQLALVSAALSGLAKGALVSAATIALSWAAVALLRRLARVAKVI